MNKINPITYLDSGFEQKYFHFIHRDKLTGPHTLGGDLGHTCHYAGKTVPGLILNVQGGGIALDFERLEADKLGEVENFKASSKKVFKYMKHNSIGIHTIRDGVCVLAINFTFLKTFVLINGDEGSLPCWMTGREKDAISQEHQPLAWHGKSWTEMTELTLADIGTKVSAVAVDRVLGQIRSQLEYWLRVSADNYEPAFVEEAQRVFTAYADAAKSLVAQAS